MQNVVHREKDGVERLLAMLFLNEIVNVRNSDLGREARVDGAAARTSAIQFGACVVGINNIFRL